MAAAAAGAVAAAGGPAAERALVQALSTDPHPAVRTASARALGGLCGARAVQALERAEQDKAQVMVQQAAKHALGRCAVKQSSE